MKKIINLKNKKIKKLITFIMMLMMLSVSTNAYAEVFQWPIENFSSSDVTSPMYYRSISISVGYHAGWDISRTSEEPIPIYAIASGTVVESTYNESMGYYVKIKHQLDTNLIIDGVDYGNVLYSRYMHLKSLSDYHAKDNVQGGKAIGIMGNTGNSSGTHLHIDIMNFNGSILKSDDYTEGLGTSMYNPWKDGQHVYTILRQKANPSNCAFSPELIIGQDLASEIIGPTGPSGVISPGDGTESESGGNSGKIRAGNTSSYGNGIVDKTDILTQLQVSGDQIDYGKLAGLESQTLTVKAYLEDFSQVVAAILIFLGVVLSGISILLNRNNPEGRMAGLTALGAVGVGGLIIGCASLLVSFIAGFMD